MSLVMHTRHELIGVARFCALYIQKGGRINVEVDSAVDAIANKHSHSLLIDEVLEQFVRSAPVDFDSLIVPVALVDYICETSHPKLITKPSTVICDHRIKVVRLAQFERLFKLAKCFGQAVDARHLTDTVDEVLHRSQ